MRSTASTSNAPQPAGPYSQCARVASIVHSAGQVGLRPDGTLVEGVGAQTEQAIRNMLAVLAAAGADEGDVVSVRVYLTDTGDFAAMNEAYAAMFNEPFPSRTTVYVGLRTGLLVEVDALAVLSDEPA